MLLKKNYLHVFIINDKHFIVFNNYNTVIDKPNWKGEIEYKSNKSSV